nr:hypothetical protein [Desulfitobacterium hafniense]
MIAKRPTVINPVILISDNSRLYLKSDSPGLTLYTDNSRPLYQLQEPVILMQGITTNPQTVHLSVLKSNGDLCYTVVPVNGTPQTSVLTNLDLRSRKYARLILLPYNGMVHIFYAHSHQAIPELWHLEHLFWNGKSWRAGHLGEVVSRTPNYHVSLDSQGNIHFLAMTFQGHQSLLLSNRFHGTFHLWGTLTETLRIQREVAEMTTILTPDNTHYVFWTVKNLQGQHDIYWAKRTKANDLSSTTWHQVPAPIQKVSGPMRGIGALEVNDTLWLLLWSENVILMYFDGEKWRQHSTKLLKHRAIEVIKRSERSFYCTKWLEDDTAFQSPLFADSIGLPYAMPARVQQLGQSQMHTLPAEITAPNEITSTFVDQSAQVIKGSSLTSPDNNPGPQQYVASLASIPQHHSSSLESTPIAVESSTNNTENLSTAEKTPTPSLDENV